MDNQVSLFHKRTWGFRKILYRANPLHIAYFVVKTWELIEWCLLILCLKMCEASISPALARNYLTAIWKTKAKRKLLFFLFFFRKMRKLEPWDKFQLEGLPCMRRSLRIAGRNGWERIPTVGLTRKDPVKCSSQGWGALHVPGLRAGRGLDGGTAEAIGTLSGFRKPLGRASEASHRKPISGCSLSLWRGRKISVLHLK